MCFQNLIVTTCEFAAFDHVFTFPFERARRGVRRNEEWSNNNFL